MKNKLTKEGDLIRKELKILENQAILIDMLRNYTKEKNGSLNQFGLQLIQISQQAGISLEHLYELLDFNVKE